VREKSITVLAAIVVNEYAVVANAATPPNVLRASLHIEPTAADSATVKGKPVIITVPAVVAMLVAPASLPDILTALPILVYRPELEKAPTTVNPEPCAGVHVPSS
jgi:hypothetical protein